MSIVVSGFGSNTIITRGFAAGAWTEFFRALSTTGLETITQKSKFNKEVGFKSKIILEDISGD